MGLGLGFILNQKHSLGFRALFDFFVHEKTTYGMIPFNANRGYGYGFSGQYGYHLTETLQLTAGIDWKRTDTSSIQTINSGGATVNSDHAVWDFWMTKVGFTWTF